MPAISVKKVEEYSFNKEDVFTWANASKDLEGQKGYFGNSIDTLKTAIEQGWLCTCVEVKTEDNDQVQNVFASDGFLWHKQYYGCFLPQSKLVKTTLEEVN